MQARQLFGVVVRSFGLVLFYLSFADWIYALSHLVSIPVTAKLSLGEDACWGALYLIAGAAVFFGAELIVRAAYGPASVNLSAHSN